MAPQGFLFSLLNNCFIQALYTFRELRSAFVLHLEEMKREIEALVIAKGFYNKPEDIPKKAAVCVYRVG